jgi:hypothetical protein
MLIQIVIGLIFLSYLTACNKAKSCTQPIEHRQTIVNTTPTVQNLDLIVYDFGNNTPAFISIDAMTTLENHLLLSTSQEHTPRVQGKIGFIEYDAVCTDVEVYSSSIVLAEPATSLVKLCYHHSLSKVFVVMKVEACPEDSYERRQDN